MRSAIRLSKKGPRMRPFFIKQGQELRRYFFTASILNTGLKPSGAISVVRS